MRQRSLKRERAFGAVVVGLVVVAVPVVYVAVGSGIEAVRDGDAATAVERGLVALVAGALPVLALAAYAHWLWVTARPRTPHQHHVATRRDEVLVGLTVAVLAIACWPVGSYAYRESLDAFAERELLTGMVFALLGALYVVFAAFCLVRYVRWMR